MPKRAPVNEDELEYALLPKSSLYLYLDSSSGGSGTTEINSEVVSQTITMKSIRIMYASTEIAALFPLVYLKLEGWGPNTMNNNLSMGIFPIFSDTSKVDSTCYPNVQMSLNKLIRKKFKWSILDSNFAVIPASKVTFLQVLMEYEISHI